MAASDKELNRLSHIQLRALVKHLRGNNRLLVDMAKDADDELVYYRKELKRTRWGGIVTVLLIVLLTIIAFKANAHDMDPSATPEQNAVNEFYSNWYQPAHRTEDGRRMISCCNKTDCSPITEMKRNGTQWFIRTELGKEQWYAVPENVWEDLQPELMESPDARSHACIVAGQVVCAVRASAY